MATADLPAGPFDGVDLQTLLMRHAMGGERFPPQLALRLVASLCGRVHAAHVRRDDAGKPLNLVHGSIALPLILVGRDGSVQVARLPPGLEGLVLQQAPEQAAGGPATVQSDVFNCGLVLYLMLTGDHPLMRETEEETRLATIACELPAPSALAHLPAGFDALVMRAVAKDPAGRYPDVRSFQAAVERVLAEPGMGATQAEVGALVDRLCPPGEDLEKTMGGGLSPEEAMRVFAAVDKLLAGKDARDLACTAALRAVVDRGPRRPRVKVDARFVPDDEAPAAADSREAHALYRELEALGFERLGIKVEINQADGRATHSVTFASAVHEAFAGIFFTFDAIPSLFLLTVFEDGAVVLTSRYARQELRAPRAVQIGHPHAAIPSLVDAHKHEVATFKARGARLSGRWGRDESLRDTHRYYENDDIFS